MLTLIVARARNGAIGRKGTIPWEAPEDLAFFQRETLGGAVIMGRATWDSLPKKPLPRRLNLVVTSRPAPADAGDAIFTTLDGALAAARVAGHHRIYGIGGAGIYAGLMPLAQRMVITEVDLEVPDADTYFPPFDPAAWRVGERTLLRADGPRCEAVEYLRA